MCCCFLRFFYSSFNSAGNKCHSLDAGVPPRVVHESWTWSSGGDEHGIIKGESLPFLGDFVRLIPGHCDPTIAMWDHVIGIRKGIVENIIAIDARGRSD